MRDAIVPRLPTRVAVGWGGGVPDDERDPLEGREAAGHEDVGEMLAVLEAKRAAVETLRRVRGLVGEVLGYAAGEFHALLDGELYLPRNWLADKERREEADIPVDATYRTKPEIALGQVARGAGRCVRMAWLCASASRTESKRSSRPPPRPT